MSQATISVEGRRVYVKTVYGDPCVAKLKSLGAHWEPATKRWWISSAKKADVEAAIAKSADKPAAKDTDPEVHGKASYKGRSYYVRWSGVCRNGESKFRLASLDGELDFWADAAQVSWERRYDEPKRLSSIRRFIEKKRQEEAEAAKQAAEVRKVAAGEPTRNIPSVSDARIIKAFFGDRAVSYDYTVTQRQWDEEDNQAPGRYCGVTVPASLADHWDAGINAAKAAGHKDMRGREALTIRVKAMHGDAAELPAELEELLAESAAKAAAEQAAKDAAAAKAAAEKAEVDALLSGLVQSTVGPEGQVTLGGARLSRGNTTYSEGRTADGTRIVREDFAAYDDYRTYFWAPADVAKSWALAYAAKSGITVEQASEWLAKYSGCHGSDLYVAIVEAATNLG